MKVAVIDTGIETSHEVFKNCISFEGLTVIEKDKLIFETTKSFEDELGHGTAVLGIICDYITTGFTPYIVKLKGLNGKFTEELLCEGLYHALQIEDIKIINISMGVITETPSERLTKLCIEAYQKNIFIVSSGYSDIRKPCYPAYFENVFGVGNGYFMSQKFYQYIPENKINILAKGTHQRIAALNSSFTESSGTSYAAAHFTGILYTILLKNKDKSRSQILEEIKSNSNQPIIEVPLNHTKTEKILSYEVTNTQNFTFYSSVGHEVKKIALYPINTNDLRAIAINKEYANKEIVLGIDFPSSETLKNSSITTIKHIPNQEELLLFDSIVIGNITDFFGIDDFKYNMLKQFIVHDKNIITWNYPIFNIIQQIIAKEKHCYTGKIYFPHYSDGFMKEIHLNLSLPPSENIPSLPMINMEEKIGDFAYQYILSDILNKRGYSVSNIAIEPQGILFGDIDIVFPFTSDRMVDLEWEKWGVFLRLAKRLVAYRKKPDIFITSVGNLLNFEKDDNDEIHEDIVLKNTIFLKGIKPDAYIGTINSTKNTESIEKSYAYAKDVLGIEPLFFITEQLIGQETNILKLKNKKKYPVLTIADAKKIVKIIEKKFSN